MVELEKAGTDTLTMLNTEPIFKEQKTLKFADKVSFCRSFFYADTLKL